MTRAIKSLLRSCVMEDLRATEQFGMIALLIYMRSTMLAEFALKAFQKGKVNGLLDLAAFFFHQTSKRGQKAFLPTKTVRQRNVQTGKRSKVRKNPKFCMKGLFPTWRDEWSHSLDHILLNLGRRPKKAAADSQGKMSAHCQRRLAKLHVVAGQGQTRNLPS